MTVLDLVRLAGEEYRLVSTKDAAGLNKRSWQVESKRQATTIVPRPDVRPGDIDDEFVISWRKFDGGICGDHDNLPGCIHIADDCQGTEGGLRAGRINVNVTQTTNVEGADPCAVVPFNGLVFHIRGRYAYTYDGVVETADRDFGGAAILATDAVVQNDTLIVGFGGTTNRIQMRDNAGTWTTASTAVYADYFAKVEDRLWRATNTNEVSQIGPTDDPGNTANWSAAITVGDDDYAITDLNGYGERLAVSKVDGLRLGDRGAIFPNVLPQVEAMPDVDNGKQTLVRGADIFYPHLKGCIRYDGFSAEEVGIQQSFPTANTADSLPGLRIRSMAAQGEYVWAACEHSGYTRAMPTGFQKTTDGAIYTNYTTQVTDNSLGTYADLGSLDTVANNDWVVVGYSAPFYGVLLNMVLANTTQARTLTIQYWNGAWTTMTTGASVIDKTSPAVNTAGASLTQTLSRSEWITWRNSGLSDWAQVAINSITAYWIRFSLSGAIDATVAVAEARVLTQEGRGWLYRGRPRRASDQRDQSIIWESIGPLTSGARYPTAIAYANNLSPYLIGGQIHVAARNVTNFFADHPNGFETAQEETAAGGFAILSKHDAGAPFLNKQFTQLNAKGRTIDSDRDIALSYRLDEGTSFTPVSSSITSSPSMNALTSVTGYAIQPKVAFNAFANDIFTEVDEIEVVFRALWQYKEQHTFLFEVADGISNGDGGVLPDGAVQLTNLEALRGTTVTLNHDATGLSKTVTVFEIGEGELFSSERGYPAMAFQVRAVEV